MRLTFEDVAGPVDGDRCRPDDRQRTPGGRGSPGQQGHETAEDGVVAKPRRLMHVEPASVPIGALTAGRGLLDCAKLCAGERGLVHGGAGGIGIFAIQLARFVGAQVTATASTRNLAFGSQ